MSIARALAALTALFLLAGTAAAKDGSIAVNGTRLVPLAAMDDYLNPRWGIGAQLAWPAPAIHRDVLVQLGLAWTNFKDHEQATSSGVRRDAQDYWRFWIGPRWDIPVSWRIQPYVGLDAAAVRHSVTSTVDQGSGRQDLGGEVHWGFGWDVTVGAEWDPWRGIGLFGGFRYLQSYGLKLPGDPEPIEIDPEYLEAFGGLFFTFERLGLQLEDDVD